MADLLLRAESAHRNAARVEAPTSPTTCRELHDAWRFAKAEWDALIYNPSRQHGTEQDDRRNGELCERACEALDVFLLCPVDVLPDLARKLRAVAEEKIFQGSVMAPAIAAMLADDARRLTCAAGA